jgi:uncharacterized membrane protein YhaH (DUF805 family)
MCTQSVDTKVFIRLERFIACNDGKHSRAISTRLLLTQKGYIGRGNFWIAIAWMREHIVKVIKQKYLLCLISDLMSKDFEIQHCDPNVLVIRI